MALNSVRPLFATLEGFRRRLRFGASARTIVVNVDPAKMAQYDLSASEVAKSIVDGQFDRPRGKHSRSETCIPSSR